MGVAPRKTLPMIKEIRVDEATCVGCGACTIIASEFFEINGQGVSQIKEDIKLPLSGEEKEEEGELLVKASQACPVKAILLQTKEE